MMMSNQPRYPIYVISKGRAKQCLTAKFLMRDNVPYQLIIEPQEYDAYAAEFGEDRLTVLPFSNLGLGSIPARNWVWERAISAGAERHWILDDNIRQIHRLYRGQRVPCESGPGFACVEDFTDRYENVGISGMNYHMFGVKGSPPFRSNVHVYSCLLIRNDIPQRWRGRYNEDADLCLQILASGLCTVLVNVFLIQKMTTMTMKGGNTEDLYKDDGRLKMARSLERVWPHVVSTDRRFRRPQHVIRDAWRGFDTPLKLKPGIDLKQFTEANEYGLKLRAVKPIKSEAVRKLLDE
jgi:hypothetical protein